MYKFLKFMMISQKTNIYIEISLFLLIQINHEPGLNDIQQEYSIDDPLARL